MDYESQRSKMVVNYVMSLIYLFQEQQQLKKYSVLLILSIQARSLLLYFKEAGYGPLVVGGISMGGLHATMVAALTPFPIGTASLVGPPSAVPVFTSV